MSTAGGNANLRPLGIGEILDAALKVYRRHFKSLTLAVLGPMLAVSAFQTALLLSIDTETTSSGTTIPQGGGVVPAFIALVVVFVIAYAIVTAACFHGVIRGYLADGASARESLAFGVRRLLPLIGLGIVAMLLFLVIAFLVGMLIAIFPPLALIGIPLIVWLLVRMSVAAPALLAERINPISAIGRSFSLVKGRWWPTFAALVAMLLLVFVLQLIVSALLGIGFADPDNEVLNAIVSTVVTALGYAISLPIQTAVFVILYYDLRVRKEGYDLQLAAQGLGGGDSPAPASSAFGEPAGAAAFGESSGGGFAAPAPSYGPPGGGLATPTPASAPDTAPRQGNPLDTPAPGGESGGFGTPSPGGERGPAGGSPGSS